MSSPKITSAPAPVEPKIGTLKTLNKKLARGAGYLGAQVKGDPTNKLSVQVTALNAAHQELTDDGAIRDLLHPIRDPANVVGDHVRGVRDHVR